MTDIISIERFIPRPCESFELETGEVLGVFADAETNSLDTDTASIIQVSFVPFAFLPDGRIPRYGQALVAFEDPGSAIPKEITELTGITDEMVARKRLPEGEINELVSGAAIVIAHNASFDRPILERRLPVFKHLRFGCSQKDLPWKNEIGCAKLSCLMYQHARLFYESHRADLDCYAGVALLSTTVPRHDGKRALSYVLDAARTSHVRLYATGAPFDAKALLKLKGYWWNNGDDGRPKAWYKDVKAGDDFAVERSWLIGNVGVTPLCVPFDSRQRFSNRIGEQVQRSSKVA